MAGVSWFQIRDLLKRAPVNATRRNKLSFLSSRVLFGPRETLAFKFFTRFFDTPRQADLKHS